MVDNEIASRALRDADSIGRIEIELLRLDRYIEMLGRKNSLYRRLDRSGYLLLRTLEKAGPLSVNGLSDALGLHASTVTRQVNCLEASSFVSRRINPDDQRSSSISLNAAGRRIMHTVERDRRGRLEAMLADWSTEEQRALGVIIAKLNAAIASYSNKAQPETPRTDRPLRLPMR